MNRLLARARVVGLVGAALVAQAAWPSGPAAADPAQRQVRRVATVTQAAGPSMQAAGRSEAGDLRPIAPSGAAEATSVTVDMTPWAGYENAIYAVNDATVFVAYKRFTQDPSGGGYIPAELRVARSTDGGATWRIRVVDPDAIEAADTLDNSVSIDGDHGSTIYVAYHTRSSGLFADMKLKVAKSTDGGATWTVHTVVDSSAGDYNSIRVLDSNTAVASAHGAGAAEGVHAYVTTNGGATWTDSLVEGGLGNGYYTSVGASSLRTVLVAWYNSLYPDHTDLNAGRRVGGSWQTMTVDGTPGDGDLTGLGASAWVAGGRNAWIAYEADTSQGAFVRVARLQPEVPGWTIVPVQQGGTIGWNTAVHSVGTSDVYVSYWYVDGTGTGRAVLASSADGGATWAPLTIQDQRHVQPYLDSTAPSTSVQFESYQTTDAIGQKPVLRVARIDSSG